MTGQEKGLSGKPPFESAFDGILQGSEEAAVAQGIPFAVLDAVNGIAIEVQKVVSGLETEMGKFLASP